MRFFKRTRPTTPIFIPDARRPSIFIIFKSPEVILTLALMVASYFALMFLTGTTSLDGPKGLWRTFGRKSRARMQSREAELVADPPLAISFDMVMVIMCAMSANAFLAACGRVLNKEQRRVEAAAEEEWLATMQNPETRKEQLAKDAQALADRVKFWQDNDERRKAGQLVRRDRIKKLDVLADEVMTNIIVGASVGLSAGAAYFIAKQPPNQIRGLGVAVMLVVLVGGLVVCGLDRYLNGMQHYCNYVNIICMCGMFALLARISVLAQ